MSKSPVNESNRDVSDPRNSTNASCTSSPDSAASSGSDIILEVHSTRLHVTQTRLRIAVEFEEYVMRWSDYKWL